MRQTTSITIEHIVVASNQPYEKVIDTFEARLGPAEHWEEITRPLLLSKASWKLVTQTIEAHIGASGLTFFFKIGESPLLFLAGKTSRCFFELVASKGEYRIHVNSTISVDGTSSMSPFAPRAGRTRVGARHVVPCDA